MRGSQDDVDQVGELRDNLRESVEYVLDAFVGGKQTECQHDRFAFDTELILEERRINERDVRDPVGDQIDLGCRSTIDFLEHLTTPLAHDNELGRKGDDRFHNKPLIRPGILQDGVQCRDNRHPEFTHECQDVTASFAAKDPELMLQTNRIHIGDV